MSMVHAYGLAARAPVWLICTRPKPGPREYGSWVRAWPGRGGGIMVCSRVCRVPAHLISQPDVRLFDARRTR